MKASRRLSLTSLSPKPKQISTHLKWLSMLWLPTCIKWMRMPRCAKLLEDDTGLFKQLTSHIAHAKQQIARFATEKIDPANLAKEIELMYQLPPELQDLRLERILATQYDIRPIVPNGNCGPTALALALTLQGANLKNEAQIRQEVTDYQLKLIKDKANPLRDFFKGNPEETIARMKRNGVYFSSIELFVFSMREKQPVGVMSIRKNGIRVIDNKLVPADAYLWGREFKDKPLILLYNRPSHDNSGARNNLDLNHYDLLIPLQAPYLPPVPPSLVGEALKPAAASA